MNVRFYAGGGGRSKFCNFIVSNDRADTYREKFYLALEEYKHIDSGGKFRNNIGGPIGDKREFQKKYKFSLAFENSSTKGYVTEKIIQAWAAGTIPIYWGDPLIDNEFNPRAFINCNDFESDRQIIEYIRCIDNDDDLYQDMMKQPIFLSGEEKYVVNTELEKFLYNIFDQPIQNAYRRNDKISDGYGFWKLHEKYALETLEMRRSALVKGANKLDKLFNRKLRM